MNDKKKTNTWLGIGLFILGIINFPMALAVWLIWTYLYNQQQNQ